MNVELKFDCAGVDWAFVSETLRRVGMASGIPRYSSRRIWKTSRSWAGSISCVITLSGGVARMFARSSSGGASRLV